MVKKISEIDDEWVRIPQENKAEILSCFFLIFLKFPKKSTINFFTKKNHENLLRFPTAIAVFLMDGN